MDDDDDNLLGGYYEEMRSSDIREDATAFESSFPAVEAQNEVLFPSSIRCGINAVKTIDRFLANTRGRFAASGPWRNNHRHVICLPILLPGTGGRHGSY